MEEVRTFAREAVREMVQDGVAEIAHWRGWEIEARDASGTVLFTVGFDTLLTAEAHGAQPQAVDEASMRVPRRMEPTLTTRRLDRPGMWPVGLTDCA
jgi:hypothetical protein